VPSRRSGPDERVEGLEPSDWIKESFEQPHERPTMNRESDDQPIPGDGADTQVSPARYGLFVGIVLAIFLVTFVVIAALALPLLDNPGPLLRGGGVVAAVCGVGLLLADVVLPIPSSLVMIAHGALFGALAGAALSLIGGVGGAALVGTGWDAGWGRRFCGACARPPSKHEPPDSWIAGACPRSS
jgi:hypothetical protein